MGKDSINIIFSPRSNQSRRTAIAISNSIKTDKKSDKLDSLIAYLADTVHSKYDLCNTLRAEVAYHHGKLPHHVRRVIEKAISEKLVRNIVCTTTLMQGVNLPAQNIIIRNPNLFVKKQQGTPPKLTNYEIANLRGRAGRLLKDLLGRTFVLDENSFEEITEEQASLFEDSTKELRPGYGDIYIEYEEEIQKDLLKNEPPINDNKEYSFLLTYIRQTILRHGKDAKERFKTVDIEMKEEEIKMIQDQLTNLKVPKDVCLKNRYWDPVDLNTLYSMRNKFQLPTAPTESDMAKKLRKIIKQMEESFPYYYERYFNVKDAPNRKVVFSICISAAKWAKEETLKKILSNKYYDDSENIDKTIDNLQNRVSFGLPMLLKPIYDISLPNSTFLRSLELGAYKPITKKLIEYGIPRETAIFLAQKYLQHLDIDSPDFDTELIKALKKNYNNLDYWIQAQLEVLL